MASRHLDCFGNKESLFGLGPGIHLMHLQAITIRVSSVMNEVKTNSVTGEMKLLLYVPDNCKERYVQSLSHTAILGPLQM